MAEKTKARRLRIPLARTFGASRQALRLVWRADRRETVAVIGLNAVRGLVLPAQVLLAKEIIEATQQTLRDSSDIFSAAPAIVVFFLLGAIDRFIAPYTIARQRLLSELVTRKMQEQLAIKAVTLDLEHFETSSFYDRLQRAQRESTRPLQMVTNLTNLVSAGVTVLAFLILIFQIEPVLALIILVAQIPIWLSNSGASRAMYQFMWGRTDEERRLAYLSSVLTGQPSAKELRIFGHANYLLDEFRRIFQERLEDLRVVIRKRAVRSLIAAAVTTALTAGGLFLVLLFYEAERIDLAEVGAILGAFLLGGQRLRAILHGMGQLYESVLFIEDFWSFLDTETFSGASAGTAPAPPSFEEMQIEGLTFSYPDEAGPAVDDVSMTIKKGQVVALVGENGAGKTTVAKLLCGLYEPQQGAVRWDGTDIRTFDPTDFRSRIAPVFQDFTRYRLTARENVGIGDIEQVEDVEAIKTAATRAGAHDTIDRLPEGYEAILGKLFLGGHELSGGEWQRIALARAFLRDSPLVILDEPTAALDARAEAALLETIRSLFAGRTVVLISHRLSTVREADRIYVFDSGRIIEEGDHGELMGLDGLYAELFRLQAASYTDIEGSLRP